MQDVIRNFKPRFVAEDVVRQLATICRRYRISAVYGDRAFAGFHSDAWRRYGIEFRPSWGTTSDNYLHFLPMAMSGRARLLDSQILRQQFISLERKPMSGGQEKIDHPAGPNYHDDGAAATAGCVAEVARLIRAKNSNAISASPIFIGVDGTVTPLFERPAASIPNDPDGPAKARMSKANDAAQAESQRIAALSPKNEPWRPYAGGFDSRDSFAPIGGRTQIIRNWSGR